MPYPLNQAGYALNDSLLAALPGRFGTPLWVYDAALIERQIASLRAFDTIRFAQKACSNLHILRLMRQAGVKVDAVSLGEIERALVAGFRPGGDDEEIVFTADVIDEATLDRICALGITVNAGSCDMLRQLGRRASGHPVWLRINPGFGHGHSQKTNTGGENSKHGIWHQDLAQALALIDTYGLRLVGLHMHIGSGVDYDHLARVCDTLANQAIALGRDIQAISAGGGLEHTLPRRRRRGGRQALLWAVGCGAAAYRRASGASGASGDRAGTLSGGAGRRAAGAGAGGEVDGTAPLCPGGRRV